LATKVGRKQKKLYWGRRVGEGTEKMKMLTKTEYNVLSRSHDQKMCEIHVNMPIVFKSEYCVLLRTHNSNCIIVFIDEIFNMASLGDKIAAQEAEIAQYKNERNSIVISDQTGDERRELLIRRDQLLAAITATQNALNILAQQSQQQGNNFHSSVPASTLICVTISGERYHGGTAE
jgi:hypothetical protein